MAVTRKQVAAIAGVSVATVSYVMNNGPRAVAPETRERVLEAIRELGYYPSEIARNLATSRTSIIGLVVPDTGNPFYGEVARVIEDMCYAQGYTVILCNSNRDEKREADYASMLRARRVEGVVILPTSFETRAIAWLREANICTVVLDAEIEGAYCIVTNDYRGSYLLTQHLLNMGHRRIGCVTYSGDISTYQTRLDGYKAALTEAGIPIDGDLIVEAGPTTPEGESAAFALLRHAPTAICAHNDRVALGVLSAVRKCGLRTPEDISVVGYDDIVESAYFHPPLTTVAYPKQQMGEAAVRLLFRLIAREPDVPPPYVQVLDVQVVERESAAPPKEK